MSLASELITYHSITKCFQAEEFPLARESSGNKKWWKYELRTGLEYNNLIVPI